MSLTFCMINLAARFPDFNKPCPCIAVNQTISLTEDCLIAWNLPVTMYAFFDKNLKKSSILFRQHCTHTLTLSFLHKLKIIDLITCIKVSNNEPKATVPRWYFMVMAVDRKIGLFNKVFSLEIQYYTMFYNLLGKLRLHCKIPLGNRPSHYHILDSCQEIRNPQISGNIVGKREYHNAVQLIDVKSGPGQF